MPNKSRFSEDQIADMARRYLSGETMAAIGASYSIHRGTVDSLLRCRGVPILSRADAKRKYPFREDAFDTIADEPTAYWLGFLCADGCVVLRRGSGEVHLVLQKRDIAHLERYRTFVETTAPIRKETNYQTYRVSLYSLHLAQTLNSLGCTPRKSLSLRFPTLPQTLVPHFVRGYFDGDGTAYYGGGALTLAFVGNKHFLSEMKEHIDGATNGNGRLYPHSMSSVWYLNYRGQFKVQAMRTWIYHEATVWLARKRDRIDGFAPGKRKGYPTANTYVGTAGRVSAETIQRYIDEQRGT